MFMPKSAALKEPAEKRCCFIRNAGNLVPCLTIEFEIELGLGSTVVPARKRFELFPSQAPLGQRDAFDGDAHPRRLPGDPSFSWDRFGRRNNAARDETRPAFILTREDKDRIPFCNALATIHRLLRAKRESRRPHIANLGFDQVYQFLRVEPNEKMPSLSLLRPWRTVPWSNRHRYCVFLVTPLN
jgi:hypothetical protein